MPVTPDVSVSVASVCLEGVFYGLFCTLFALHVYLSIEWPNRSTSRTTYPRPMLCFTMFIFLTVTMHWILSVVRMFQAFTINKGSPSEFLDDLSQPSAILGAVTLMILILMRDLTVIYRVWVIYSYHKGSIIAPMMMFVSLIGFVVAFMCQTFLPYTTPGSILPAKHTSHSAMLLGVFIVTFGINIYCTALIASKVYRSHQLVAVYGLSSQFSFIPAVMVESLALCAAWGAFVLLSYEATSDVFSLAFNVQSPVTGIAFVLVQVRVGMHRIYTTTMWVPEHSEEEQHLE